MKIALQLYTLAGLDTLSMEQKLSAAAAAGYDGVEFAGYGGLTAAELKGLLERYGLEAAGTHIGYDALKSNPAQAAAFAKELGCKSAVVPYAQFETAEQWRAFGAELERFGQLFRDEGLLFGYHNHAHEFQKIGGAFIIDLLFEQTLPEHVLFEMDTFWVVRGGEDPAVWAKKYADRMPLLHAKDPDQDGRDTEIGCGVIDFPAVVQAAGNVEWLIVEQEEFDRPPLESIQISCDNLKRRFQ